MPRDSARLTKLRNTAAKDRAERASGPGNDRAIRYEDRCSSRDNRSAIANSSMAATKMRGNAATQVSFTASAFLSRSRYQASASTAAGVYKICPIM